MKQGNGLCFRWLSHGYGGNIILIIIIFIFVAPFRERSSFTGDEEHNIIFIQLDEGSDSKGIKLKYQSEFPPKEKLIF